MFTSRSSKARKGNDNCAIFVHAGAGFHSRENEMTHLTACNDACKAGMAIMKHGGSAVDAVEVAIKVLEDREITNAGFGSNLGFDGIVECDAIIVDHLGRSGAAGAVAQIKNPISLARLLYDHAAHQMSLKRVPPNLLVGPGATKFAADHGMPVVPYDMLISKFARHRWQKWRADLCKVERYGRRGESPVPEELESASRVGLQDFVDEHNEHENVRASHEKAMIAAVWNDAQPISPELSAADSTLTPPSEVQPDEFVDLQGPPGFSLRRPRLFSAGGTTGFFAPPQSANPLRPQAATDGGHLPEHFPSPQDSELQGDGQPGDVSPSPPSLSRDASPPFCQPDSEASNNKADHITDTVGVIAVDGFGNIACGASSGGIGIKHRGRVGPAALVGIGAHVIPVDEDDEEKKAVATVTSGTGEHMSSTMSASVCSERVLHEHMKKRGGGFQECEPFEAVRSFIERDFMGHPAVKYSDSPGAIGTLTVKKTAEGMELLFGHNTSSFALASMHSDEKNPVCTMSRGRGEGSVAQGGRYIRFKGKK